MKNRTLAICRTFIPRGAAIVALFSSVLATSPALADGGGSIAGEVVAKPKNRVGVVVFLEKVPGTFRPPAKPAAMNQKGMKFIPHILAVQKGTTVSFINEDAVQHNVFSPDNEKYNLGSWPKGDSKPYTFKTPGIYHQLCNVHPEMGAVIVVLENPFFSVTGEDGKFKIENVPPGTYTLKTWAEKGPAVSKSVTVTAGGTVEEKLELGK